MESHVQNEAIHHLVDEEHVHLLHVMEGLD
jgi:hypothetical protein